MELSSFEQAIKTAAEKAVLKVISEGSWIMPDYTNRMRIPHELITDAWNMVDVDGIKRQLAKRLEAELADRIVNHMAAEIATDVKQILSVRERREMLRNIAREHMEAIMQAGIDDDKTASSPQPSPNADGNG